VNGKKRQKANTQSTRQAAEKRVLIFAQRGAERSKQEEEEGSYGTRGNRELGETEEAAVKLSRVEALILSRLDGLSAL